MCDIFNQSIGIIPGTRIISKIESDAITTNIDQIKRRDVFGLDSKHTEGPCTRDGLTNVPHKVLIGPLKNSFIINQIKEGRKKE